MNNENSGIDPKVQEELNRPLKMGSFGQDNKAFLQTLVSLISEGKIDLFRPSSIINENIYMALDDQKRGQADLEAVNLLNSIRDIHGLYKAGFSDTYQMENLVERLRLTKERLEEIHDIFII